MDSFKNYSHWHTSTFVHVYGYEILDVSTVHHTFHLGVTVMCMENHIYMKLLFIAGEDS